MIALQYIHDIQYIVNMEAELAFLVKPPRARCSNPTVIAEQFSRKLYLDEHLLYNVYTGIASRHGKNAAAAFCYDRAPNDLADKGGVGIRRVVEVLN